MEKEFLFCETMKYTTKKFDRNKNVKNINFIGNTDGFNILLIMNKIFLLIYYNLINFILHNNDNNNNNNNNNNNSCKRMSITE